MTREIDKWFSLICLNMLFVMFTNAQTLSKDSGACKSDSIKQIGYGSQASWITTSAISSVSGGDLQRSFTSNLGNTLYGRLSGLTSMQGRNEPGIDAPTMYIRGINTYGTGRSILVMVDGIQGSIDQLIPEEIESISVLKDASATAIYGSRGANGVLLITTKRGRNGSLSVKFSTQQGFTQAQSYPNFLDSYGYASLYNEALINDGKKALYSKNDLEAYRTRSDLFYHPNVNWYNEVLSKAALASNYNLNLSGGNDWVRYYVLLNVLNRDGLVKKTAKLSENSTDQNYSRFNLRTNIDIKLSKNMSAVLLLSGSIDDKSSPYANNTTSLFATLAALPPNAFPVYNEDGSIGGNSLYSNPYGDILNRGFFVSKTSTTQTVFKLTEKLDMITKGLSISGLIGFNSLYTEKSNKSRTYERYLITQDTLGLQTKTRYGQNTSLSSDEGMLNSWRNVTIQSYLNYERTFGEHELSAMAMFNYETYSPAGLSLPQKYLGIGGRFTYANQGKYIGELSFAYNATENFPANSRWGLFPAVSLGWIISKENFMQSLKSINFMKFKTSYGLVGNDDIGGTRFMFNEQSYIYGSNMYFGTTNNLITPIFEGEIANSNVTWEKETKLNFGLEATVFKNIDFSVDLFKNDRNDILSLPTRTYPQFLGYYALPKINIGKTRNVGFEADIAYNSDKSKSFEYHAKASVWYAKNKIVYNDEQIQSYDYLYRTGHKIDQPFVLEAVGFFKSQDDIDNSPTQIFATSHPGDLKYKDQNGDDIVDQNDYVPMGKTSIPELTIGLEVGCKFKGFDLNSLFQCVTNRGVYLSGYYYQAFQNYGKVTSMALGRWTPETAETATYPRLSSTTDLNNFQGSSFWQRDGSFLKLRNMEIGYTLSKKILDKIQLSNARIFVNGTNLFSIHNSGIVDPESNSDYPSLRCYSLGASIQLK